MILASASAIRQLKSKTALLSAKDTKKSNGDPNPQPWLGTLKRHFTFKVDRQINTAISLLEIKARGVAIYVRNRSGFSNAVCLESCGWVLRIC